MFDWHRFSIYIRMAHAAVTFSSWNFRQLADLDRHHFRAEEIRVIDQLDAAAAPGDRDVPVVAVNLVPHGNW